MYKKIHGKYEHKFAADKDGLYSIILEATCQKRNDLKVEIDETKLREFPAEDRIQYYKIPPSWNGNELKGTSKTVVLILELLQGEHSLKFETEGEAELLAEPKINFLERKALISVLKNIQSQKKNRQPWITAVLINLPLNFLDISAICQKRFMDSDDLQLIIDGEIQKHSGSLWWGKNWLWQGRLSKGATETKRIYKKLNRGIHYIELWADVAPTIESFQLSLGVGNSSEDENYRKDIREYTYKGVSGEENYNRYDDEIKEVVAHWNREFFSQKYPPDEPLDPNLVKAMIYQESRVGYEKSHNGEINVMQVGNEGDPSLEVLNGEKAEYELINDKLSQVNYKGNAEVKTVYDSIFWGTRWLFHRAQYVGIKDGIRHWRSWRDAAERYGPPRQGYGDNVWNIYTQGVDERVSPPVRIWLPMLLMFALTSLGIWGYDGFVKSTILSGLPERDRAYNQGIETKYYWREPSLFFATVVTDKDWWERLEAGRYRNGKINLLTISEEPTEQSILQAKFLHLNGFNSPILEVYGQTHVGHGAFYLYKIENDEVKLILESRAAVDMNNDARWAPDNFEKYGYTECGEIYRDGKLKSSYEDMNGDRVADVVLSGTEETVCEARVGDEKGEWLFVDEKVAESEVRKVFLWDKEKGKFFEQTQVALSLSES